MMKKEEVEKMFGWAMEDTADAAYKAYIESKWNYYSFGCAFGKLRAFGLMLGLSEKRIMEISTQQETLAKIGQ